jgi:cAMP-dependent protein kinase regulator
MRDQILRALAQSPAFAGFDDAARQKFADVAQWVEVRDGDTVIRKGDPGEAFYVIAAGEAEVAIDEPGGVDRATLYTGDFFGEMAIIWNQPRAATIKARTGLKLVRFLREPLIQVLRDNPDLRDVLVQVGLLRAEENIERFMVEEF